MISDVGDLFYQIFKMGWLQIMVALFTIKKVHFSSINIIFTIKKVNWNKHYFHYQESSLTSIQNSSIHSTFK